MGHEPKGLTEGLRNQQSIKRVEMMRRQVLDRERMRGRDRERVVARESESRSRLSRGENDGGVALSSERMLDSYFP